MCKDILEFFMELVKGRNGRQLQSEARREVGGRMPNANDIANLEPLAHYGQLDVEEEDGALQKGPPPLVCT